VKRAQGGAIRRTSEIALEPVRFRTSWLLCQVVPICMLQKPRLRNGIPTSRGLRASKR
jgi:hypothetical protein